MATGLRWPRLTLVLEMYDGAKVSAFLLSWTRNDRIGLDTVEICFTLGLFFFVLRTYGSLNHSILVTPYPIFYEPIRHV